LRAIRFLPLAFVADVHGFLLFAPYLAFAMSVAHIVWARRRRNERLAANELTAIDSSAVELPEIVDMLEPVAT
jgi:hypothetical protein